MSKLQLRPYQIEIAEKAAEILHEHGLVYLAMECRTGKSFSAMQTAVNIGAKSVLFITTKKAIPSIETDYKRLKEDNPYIFSLKVTNYEDILAKQKAVEKAATAIVADKYPGIAVRSVRFQRELATEKIRQRELLAPYTTPDNIDVVIVDEAHKAGAFPRPSGTQQAIRNIARDKKVIFLSGTPTPESSSQMFHVLQISDRSPWAQYRTFYDWVRAGYVKPKEKMLNGYKITDYSDADFPHIKKDIDHLIISLTQQEAGFTTEIEEHTLYSDLLPSTHESLLQLRRNRVAKVYMQDGSTAEIIANTPADLLNKMHQLSGGTIIIEGNGYIVDESKAHDIARMFAGRHIAIFTCYQAEKELLIRTFPNWTDVPEVFNKDKEKTFICQIRSCREGVSLATADALVYYNPEYSYLSYEQGKQRAVTKDKKKASQVWFSVSNCGIERNILEAVREKQDFTLQWYYQNYGRYD